LFFARGVDSGDGFMTLACCASRWAFPINDSGDWPTTYPEGRKIPDSAKSLSRGQFTPPEAASQQNTCSISAYLDGAERSLVLQL
jgi:hypothetical protein